MKDNNIRDEFKTKLGFIIACVGSAVGMGNIWMFPYRIGEFGGAAFLVPYFIPTSFYTVYCFSVCAIGVLASTEELIVHIKSTTYNPDIKSVFYMNKQ